MVHGGGASNGVSLDSGTARRVLVVCGEPRVLAEIKMELMESFEVGIAATGETALAALNLYGADAVVICAGKESAWAFSAFSAISACAADRGVPVLFLAEKDSEADEAAAFKAGAADYSVRRRAVGGALVSRIKLRIRAGVPGEAASTESVLAGRTILIAEDVELNQQVIAAMLSDLDGLTIDFVYNGAQAVERFKKNPSLYSIIFMDIYMPEMDGLSASRAIRSLDCANAREVPIIALTASTTQDDIEGFLEAGMNCYLKKPLDYEIFLEVSRKYCKRN